MNRDYQKALGDKLRSVRQMQGLTLHDVEERSNGEWKSVVIGSYERGDRAVSIAKLAQLAAFYGVPLSGLLPQTVTTPATESPTVILDLTKLDITPSVETELLGRYATTIQQQRGDYNGKMLTLRRADIEALSVALGTSAESLIDMLRERELALT